MASYKRAVEDSSGPEERHVTCLSRLERAYLVDAHDTICKAFARSAIVFFISEIKISTRLQDSGARREEFRWMGHASGQQQGGIRQGDGIVRTGGMCGHAIVRRDEKTLVARLNDYQPNVIDDYEREYWFEIEQPDLEIR